mmetsp:Transcript_23730/g.57234  ORF Transcript_23730/g.57234 Transcript_23730/m.57234 type:complete len:610 (+) Transcript_23730:127-1956(+)
MASADPPTPANLDHQDDAATLTCPRLPDGHPAVKISQKLASPSPQIIDVVDSPPSAWRVPPPPPEPPPPPQPPPPPPWCPPSTFPPVFDSGLQQHPVSHRPSSQTQPVHRRYGDVDSLGLSSAWRAPPPKPPPPPQPPPPPWCPSSSFPPTFDVGFQQHTAPTLPFGTRAVRRPVCSLTERGDSLPTPPEPPPSWIPPVPIPPWPPPTPSSRRFPSHGPLAIVASYSNSICLALPIVSLFHPRLWSPTWSPPLANQPSAIARGTNKYFSSNRIGEHTVPPTPSGAHTVLPTPSVFIFGTPASSAVRPTPPLSFNFAFTFSPPFPNPLAMVSGRIRDANERATTQHPKRSGGVGDLPSVADLPRLGPSHASHVMSTGTFLRIKNILANTTPRAHPVRTTRRSRVRATPCQPLLHGATTPTPFTSSIRQSKKNYVKLLWRIGDITKPVYTSYCTRLNSLHHDYLRGSVTSSQLQARQDELLEDVNTLRLSSYRSRTHTTTPPGCQASPPTTTLHPVTPPSLISTYCRSHIAARGLHNNQWRRRQWRRKENRVIFGGNSLPQQLMAWWSCFSARAELLNRKRPAVSVALEAARILETTQRMIPFPRRRPFCR